MKRSAKVSVVMPCFNAAETVSSSVRSVLNQSYDNLELIVVDDGSTDASSAVVSAFLKDPRVSLIELAANQGVAYARNQGLKQASGDYICFLDADDLWLADKLTLQMEHLEDQRYLCCHGSYFEVLPDGSRRLVKAKPIVSHADMSHFNHIGNLTGIYCAKALGKFYQQKIGHEDYVMWHSIMERTDSIGVEKPIAEYRICENSLSRNKWLALIWYLNIQRNCFRYSTLRTYYNFLFFAYHQLTKRI